MGEQRAHAFAGRDEGRAGGDVDDLWGGAVRARVRNCRVEEGAFGDLLAWDKVLGLGVVEG